MLDMAGAFVLKIRNHILTHQKIVPVLHENGSVSRSVETVSNGVIVEAVRLRQQNEGYTPCFGWESPLIPVRVDAVVPGSSEARQLCGVSNCCWKAPCDRHRLTPAAALEEFMEEQFVRDTREALCRAQEADVAVHGQGAVVEAPEVWSGDRHVGADVPAEKARPLVKQGSEPVGQVSAGKVDSFGMQTGGDETASAIISRLADSAEAFISAIQELARQGAGWSCGVRKQLADLQGRFDQLAQMVSEQKSANSSSEDRYQHLSAVVASMQESGTRLEAEVGVLRADTREQSDSVSGRLEELGTQLRAHQEEFSRLQSTVSELASKMATWCERLDRQGDVLHSLCELQTQRAATLGQLLEVITQLRTLTLVPAVRLIGW